MFDFIDMLSIHDHDFLEGNYYPKKPKSPKDHSILFGYEMVDENAVSYAKILNNLRADQATCTIRTHEDIGWKIKGYVVTQDDLCWQIVDFRKILMPESNKEALRVVKQSSQTEYIIRLIAVENPWELQ